MRPKRPSSKVEELQYILEMIVSERKDVYALIDKFTEPEEEISIADALVEILRPHAEPQKSSFVDDDDDYQKNIIIPEEVNR